MSFRDGYRIVVLDKNVYRSSHSSTVLKFNFLPIISQVHESSFVNFHILVQYSAIVTYGV